MALKLDISPSYRWPVSFDVAGDGPENPETVSFNATYQRISKTRHREILDDLGSQSPTITDADIRAEVWIGWDVPGADGETAPFDDKHKAALFEYLGAEEAVVMGWMESLTAGARKN